MHSPQHRFELYAQTNPGAPALETSGHRLTYGELDSQADGLALLLQRRGVGPDSLCGVCLPPSVALARAVLAVLKAGAAALLLADGSHAAPPPALTLVARRSAAGSALLDCAEDDAGLPYGWPDEHVAVPLAPAWLVRGPAGLLPCSREDAAAGLAALQRAAPLGQGDALLQHAWAPPAMRPWEVLWPLSHGARLVVAGPLARTDHLRQMIGRHHITVMHELPLLRPLLAEGGPGLRPLRTVLRAGVPGAGLPSRILPAASAA